jgi:hypothetical protein
VAFLEAFPYGAQGGIGISTTTSIVYDRTGLFAKEEDHMQVLGLLLQTGAVVFAMASGGFWVEAARAKVLAIDQKQVGALWDGGLNVKNEKSEVLDFHATFAA